MKLASFERALGAAATFLGYLGEMSQLQYQPQFATWQAQQQANLQAWQTKWDLYKFEMQNYYNTLLQDDAQAFEMEMAEMEIEAELQAAKAQGAGQMIGGFFQLKAASI